MNGLSVKFGPGLHSITLTQPPLQLISDGSDQHSGGQTLQQSYLTLTLGTWTRNGGMVQAVVCPLWGANIPPVWDCMKQEPDMACLDTANWESLFKGHGRELPNYFQCIAECRPASMEYLVAFELPVHVYWYRVLLDKPFFFHVPNLNYRERITSLRC